MKISKSTKVWHVTHFLVHFFNASIGCCNTVVHTLLKCCHFGFNFFNSLLVTIVFFLGGLGWRCISQFLLLQSDLFFNGCLSFFELFLELLSKCLRLLNCLNMLSVFINSWVFTSFFFLESFLLGCGFFLFLQVIRLLLSCGHLRFVRE